MGTSSGQQIHGVVASLAAQSWRGKGNPKVLWEDTAGSQDHHCPVVPGRTGRGSAWCSHCWGASCWQCHWAGRCSACPLGAVMPGHGWLELGEAQTGLVQEVCSHPSSPALGEGTGWHGSLQRYPGHALLPPFQPLTKAPGSAVEQVLFFAVCPQGSVCPVPELAMCQLSRRCPPCGRWLHRVPLITLSGAGEPGQG